MVIRQWRLKTIAWAIRVTEKGSGKAATEKVAGVQGRALLGIV
jgi:hypothetical protein